MNQLHNLLQFTARCGAALGLAAATAAQAAPTSCYTGELEKHRPMPQETLIALVDMSTTPDGIAEEFTKSFKSRAGQPGRRIVVLSYAGHAPGESLRIEFEMLTEPLLDDPAVIDNTVIRTYKLHQKCIRDQQRAARDDLDAAFVRVFGAMPITTRRSEIGYALASTVDSYIRPGHSLLLMHFSDGMQLGERGRSFYGAGGRPRLIDAAAELRAFGADAPTAPRRQAAGTRFSVLWWGMLAMPVKTGAKKEYIDTTTVGAFTGFWDGFARTLGATRVQIGAPHLINPEFDGAASPRPLARTP